MATYVAAASPDGTPFISNFDRPVSMSDWAVQSAYWANPTSWNGGPPRVQVLYDSPPPGCKSYVRLTALDADVSPLTPTDNPRSQLYQPSASVYPGNIYQFSWWTRFNYTPPSTSWYAFHQTYGPPFNTVSSLGIGNEVGNTSGIFRPTFSVDPDNLGSGASVWSFDLPSYVGVWMRFVYRVYATTKSDGWIEIDWAGDGTANAVPQILTGNVTRKTIQTLNAGEVIGTHFYLNVYRDAGLEAESIVDHAGARVDILPSYT
jgi:hypothetical protein